MKIGMKIWLGYLTGAVILVVLAATAYQATGTLTRSLRLVANGNLVLINVERTLSDMLSA